MAMFDPDRDFDGPIPGENYTADTRNYPWHRPPEIEDLDEAIEWAFTNLTQFEVAKSIITFLSMDIPISDIVEMFIIRGMMDGKWTLDIGLLMAGPVAHILCLMADEYELDYRLGIEPQKHIPSPKYFKAMEVNEQKAQEAAETVLEGLEEVTGGFMDDVEGTE